MDLAKSIADAIIGVKVGDINIADLHKFLDDRINNISIKVYREDKNIPLPTYGKNGDACCDIYVKRVIYEFIKDNYIVHTGLHFELPENYEMEIRPRSSNTKTDYYLPNSPCTLDQGYRGELLLIFKNRTNIHILQSVDEVISGINGLGNNVSRFKQAAREELNAMNDKFPYKVGDRCAQLIIRRREKITWNEVESLKDLDDSERGVGGFGSTGK